MRVSPDIVFGMLCGLEKQAEEREEVTAEELEEVIPETDDERDLLQHMMRVVWDCGARPLPTMPLLSENAKQLENTVLLRALDRANKRLLPGAKLIRSGRPITDILKKFKKIQRRALKGSMIGFRKTMKANQKALITSARRSARSAYR